MDSACGPPQEMADKREELTPMMAQYHDLCARYDDAIVLFQVGDFYETFCEAAERTARLLELTLTSREDSTGEYPMTGIPVDNAASYVERLLDAGYRVAVADQVEAPDDSPGVVERAVTRVITPGTLTEDELLGGDENNFVAAVATGPAEIGAEPSATGADRMYGLALLDVSTGDFVATGDTDSRTIADELRRFAPAEVVLGPDAASDLVPGGCMVTPVSPVAFERERTRRRLAAYVGDLDTALASDAEVRACGALLGYAEYTRGRSASAGSSDGAKRMDEANDEDAGRITFEAPGDPHEPRLEYLSQLRRYDPCEHLLLDAVALHSLELFEPRSVHGREEATLVSTLDETACALGRRRLHDWLRRPLLSPERIRARLDAVDELTRAVREREELHSLLADVYDLERLIGRVSRRRANARDLRALRDTLAVVPNVRSHTETFESDRLRSIHEALDPLEDVRDMIDEAIVDDPPIELTEGGIVAEGFDADLDEVRAAAREGKRWIEDLEETERERTGIDSLSVGSSGVHGYYIEVTNPNLDDVPEDYQRRQTLKRTERFVTPELKSREDEIVRADARADDREYELFREVRETVAGAVSRVQTLADALASLDALISLATVAAERDYCRPEITAPEDDEPVDPAGTSIDSTESPPPATHRIEIDGGRHPVVERAQDSFVPNDARFGPDRRLAVITGPNMAGKSTYMRQVACIVLLAQVGSFVPANRARIVPVERIFTRVGASDDIAGGRSTFMVEMDELATILRDADDRSLVLLDEVGRGTSTTDGLAIARAMAEHLHDEVGSLTLFATHHHSLTEVARRLPGACRLRFEASAGNEGDVTFDHRIEPGAATGSYGIDVAKKAGVPDSVVERARRLVAEGVPDADAPPAGSDTRVSDDAPIRDSAEDAGRRASADGGDDPTDVAAELRALDIAQLTPVDALTELDRLKRALEE